VTQLINSLICYLTFESFFANLIIRVFSTNNTQIVQSAYITRTYLSRGVEKYPSQEFND